MDSQRITLTNDLVSRKPVGGSDLRIDSVYKVTGETRYVEDQRLPEMLYGFVLRSPHHHARLLDLDVSPALRMPGVRRVITAADIPGENSLGDYSRDEPLLTSIGAALRQRGAPVALVVAETFEIAQRAAGAIQAGYEILPHTFSAQEALQPDATAIYPDGNLLSTFTLAHGDLQAAFEQSQVLIETEYATGYLEHCAMEREAALGYPSEDGGVTVIGGTHEPHWQQGYIAPALGIDPASVRVIVPPTGGSFGGRQDPWPLAAVGLMAFLVGKPVRLSYSRREVFVATTKRHPYHVNFKLGATRRGKLTGIQVRVLANTGGYDSAGYYIPNYAITASGGAYAWQAVDGLAHAVYTNGPKSGQFRGFGTSQSNFALECTLDELAQALDMDPLDLRAQNHLQQGQVSFLGYPVAESLGYAEVLQAIQPSYQAFTEEMCSFNAASGASSMRMGVGLAGMWYRFGKSGSLRIEAHAELAEDGRIVIYCSAPDYGQGIATVMVQLAAEALGLPRSQVVLVNADTGLVPDSGVQGASRATYFTGGAVCVAAENLKRELFAAAAEMLDHHPQELLLNERGVSVITNPEQRVTLQEVAAEFDLLGKPRRVNGFFDLSPQFPEAGRPEYIPLFVTGAQAAQVIVDLETGIVQVKRIAAAHDVGRVINRLDAVGQVQGAIVMGIGGALSEEYIPGATTGFSDYILPMIDAIPEIQVHFVEVPSYHGPLGAKGLGEAAMLPTAPAVINAVSRAIGKRIRRIPATPLRVLQAIQSA
ncbi:MAG: xanthine dehydrogenase family protein molybdopterin-binding subunit [Anaerolineae bacterium]|nr:xanthine dehydrogenase family protein molybdopterin-binding subunit [Anaerolineae bacterium]